MKVLYFGDTVGSSGRKALKLAIKKLVPQYQADFVVVNGENFAHGYGILPRMAEEFFALGVNVITTGNHAWDNQQIIPYFETNPHVIRPANYPNHLSYPVPGKGAVVVQSKQSKLGVIQVMGRVLMESIDCPFQAIDREIMQLKDLGIHCILVDFHAEATSEKQAFAYYVDGKVSAVVGSHTHVQTADERLLPQGTAAITDVGMCGCFDSVIGMEKEIAIQKLITKRPLRLEPAEGVGGYGAVVVDIEENSGRALSILRLREEKIE